MHHILEEILNRCAAIEILERRNVAEQSCDLVFSAKNREDVNRLFGDIFGLPLKPTGESPGLWHRLITRKYGGIRRHQKLFAKRYDSENMTAIAMFRPWKYGKYFTVKLAVVSNTELEKVGPTLGSALAAWLTRLFCRPSRSA